VKAVLVATGLAALACAGCSPSGGGVSSAEASTGATDTSGVVALLTECEGSQRAVTTALEGSDRDVTLQALGEAHSTCTAAATKLRETPIPSATVDSAEAANAIDQMTRGLDKVQTAVTIMDSSPARAKRIAHAGLLDYLRGSQRLKSAVG
jgi:hypothetical protein